MLNISIQITISGSPGVGKTTIAKWIAEKLGVTHISTGEIVRNFAKKHKTTIEKLNEKQKLLLDKEIYLFEKKLASSKKNFVEDGRLGFHFIKHSFKIFITCNPHVSAQRVFHNQRETEMSYRTVAELEHAMRNRGKEDEERYEKEYHLNYLNPKYYDFVLDTTALTVEEAGKKILLAFENFHKNEKIIY